MQVTFLGTGTSQGVPVIGCSCAVCRSLDYRDKRLRTSVHILTDSGLSLLIDTGPDFRTQALAAGLHRLDAVLFTHAHKDHTAGLDDVRPFVFRQQQAMPLFGQAAVLEQLQREFAYAFAPNPYPGTPRFELTPIGTAPFSIAGQDIIPVEALHHRLPVLGFRIGDFSYITDANYISDVELEKLRGSRVFVINALQQEPKHLSHYTLPEAMEVASAVGAPQTYFTHISHRMGLHAEVQARLESSGMALAHDGLVVQV